MESIPGSHNSLKIRAQEGTGGGGGGGEGGLRGGRGDRGGDDLCPGIWGAYVHQMFQMIQNNTLSSLFRGVGAGRGVYIPRNRLSVRVRFWKTTRRDRARVCAKFERPRRFRGSNMNHTKKARQCRGLALDPCLDSSIPRSSNSFGQNCPTELTNVYLL